MTAQKIKDVSLKLFSQHGYDGTSLSEIAKEVGINKSSIYAHFKSKESIFMAVFDDALWDYNKHVEQLIIEIQDQGVDEKLYRILCDVAHYYEQNQDLKLFLKRSALFPPTFLQEQLLSKSEASDQGLIKVLHSIFEEGIRKKIIMEDHIDDLVQSYLCVLDGIFSGVPFHKSDYIQGQVNNIWRIFWKGIRA